MDYFVSAENNAYHRWQLDLLIESFKMQGQQDNLLIALAEGDQQYPNHPRIFRHANVGKMHGCSYLNRPYSILAAMKHGMVKRPVTIIEPDMILNKPIEINEGVHIQIDRTLSAETLPEDIKPCLMHEGKLLWLPLGRVWAIHDLDIGFFERVVEWCEALLHTKYRFLEQIAWMCALIERCDKLTLHEDYEMQLIDHGKDHHFIHYSHGLPPMWTKYAYKYEDVFSAGNPYHDFLKNNPTSTTNLMQKVIQSLTSSGQ